MQRNALRTISGQQVLSSDQVVKEWLVRFAEIFRYQGQPTEVTPTMIVTYCSLLSDIHPKLLARACEQAARTCRFFPTVADIRGHVDRPQAEARQLEAEQRWNYVIDVWLNRSFHPDVGISRNAPKLDDRTWHAIKAAGGLNALYYCETDKLPFRKKEFIEAYDNFAAVERDRNFLPESDAKKLLEQVQQRLNDDAPTLLPGPRPTARSGESSEKQAATGELMTNTPATALTDEKVEARRAQIKQQHKDWTTKQTG